MAADEVGLSHRIGAGIAKGTGPLPTGKFKKPKGESGKEKRQQVFQGQVVYDPAAPSSTNEPEIIDAEIISESSPRAIKGPQKALPGGQRWDEFKAYTEAHKSGKLTPPIKLD